MFNVKTNWKLSNIAIQTYYGRIGSLKINGVNICKKKKREKLA